MTRLLVESIGWLGRPVLHIGHMVLLLIETCGWIARSPVERSARIGLPSVIFQIVRVGVRSMFIVSLVSGAVGLILSLQLAPPLDGFGQRQELSRIIGVAVLRELGPLIGAIVLTGFAGAAIAAELGTMAVNEEIEALEAHAIDPVRFLVAPRVLGAAISMTVLGVLSDVVAIAASLGISLLMLDIPTNVYMNRMLDQVSFTDFWTGLIKAAIFGLLIGLIACGNGLATTNGARGVGDATTRTVVECVVAIVIADLVFTAIFYALELF